MKKLLSFTTIIFAIVSLSSCATVFHGTNQMVRINSNPPGADVEVNGLHKGATPIDVSLKKGFTGQTVVLKKAGFEDKSFNPAVKFDPISLINVFAVIGFGVDAATGAMMKYDQAEYTVPLTKKN